MRDRLRRSDLRARPATRWGRRSYTPAKSYSILSYGRPRLQGLGGCSPGARRNAHVGRTLQPYASAAGQERSLGFMTKLRQWAILFSPSALARRLTSLSQPADERASPDTF
jgi:hypothetical protein